MGMHWPPSPLTMKHWEGRLNPAAVTLSRIMTLQTNVRNATGVGTGGRLERIINPSGPLAAF